MTRPGSRRAVALAVLLVAVLFAAPGEAAPEGQLTWGVHITLAPTWFDPAETPSLITPFMMMYALHVNGHGPRVQESGLGLIPGHAYSAPYEDVRIKK
jgi:hypothetical protein